MEIGNFRNVLVSGKLATYPSKWAVTFCPGKILPYLIFLWATSDYDGNEDITLLLLPQKRSQSHKGPE